jgi:hypothetical protein
MKTVIEMALSVVPEDDREDAHGYELLRLTYSEIERFAELVRADEREACGRVRAAKPRELKPVGRGRLLDEQQFCFDKGWREGAASVRAAIRARSNIC